MEKLPEKLVINAMRMIQIRRKENIAIYKMLKDPHGYQYPCYEVIKIQRAKAKTIRNYHYPDREIYPTPEEWGKYAWSYKSFPQALEKYRSLLRK